MKSYIAFVKKEFIENLRTFKILIIGVVFLLFGIMSPVIAKLTPEIIKSVGLSMSLPDPTALDSWTQFFKNIGQMGLFVLVIVFCGIMANEFTRGTLIIVLTKGLRRNTVILSKLTMAALIWTLSYLIALFVCLGYTTYLWPSNPMDNVFIAFFSMWLFGILLISLVILGGVLFKNIYGSLLLTGGAVVIMLLLSIAPNLEKYNPITLVSNNVALLASQKTVADFAPALSICSGFIIILTVGSIMIFNKKQL